MDMFILHAKQKWTDELTDASEYHTHCHSIQGTIKIFKTLYLQLVTVLKCVPQEMKVLC